MSIKGRAAENAIIRASKHYALVDRGEVFKQRTPTLQGIGYSASAPIDFRGWFGADRAPCNIEVKATQKSFIAFDESNGIRESQLDSMRDSVRRGIAHWLVADFDGFAETYLVDAKHVVDFAAAPWRSSLSRDWCRAMGDVCKVSDRDTAKMCIWWLDARADEFQSTAALAVAAEKARAEGETVELYPARGLRHGKRDDKFRELMARKPGHAASDVEIIRWRDEMSELDLERNIAEAKSPRGRAKAKKKLNGWY